LTDWAARLEDEKANLASRVKAARSFYDREGARLQRYHGGMPVGFLAAIAQWESGGKMTAGDAGLGEYGYFQVAGDVPPKFGVHADVRRTEEGNIFLACLEYQVEAFKVQFANVDVVANGSEDQWKLARLAFAIGAPGTRRLIQLARDAGLVHGPGLYNALRNYVNTHEPPELGSQSPGKVWFRVHAVDLLWQVGQEVLGGWPGVPVRIPAFVPYSLPAGINLPAAAGLGALLAVALAAGAAFMLRRMTS